MQVPWVVMSCLCVLHELLLTWLIGQIKLELKVEVPGEWMRVLGVKFEEVPVFMRILMAMGRTPGLLTIPSP